MVNKILIVDDETDFQRLVLLKFRKRIANKEFELLFANNGEEALSLLKHDPTIGIILTDLNMPIMDGITFLTNLIELNKKYKTVVISAYQDMDHIRRSMHRGASDYLTKPIDFNDLERIIDKMNLSETERAMNLRLNKEFDAVELIQNCILPKNYFPIPGNLVEITGTMIPAREVGIDFYDFVPIGENKIAFLISKVLSNNVEASLHLVLLRTFFRMLSEKLLTCGQILTELNTLMTKYGYEMIVTSFITIIDYEKEQLTYSNAGHIAPYLLHSDRKMEHLNMEPGPAFGISHKIETPVIYVEEKLNLKVGDCIFLYTDGITNAEDRELNKFGKERLELTLSKLCDSSPQVIIENIVNQLNEFIKNIPQTYDMTMLAIRYNHKIQL